MRRLVKRLKELQQFDIALSGDIKEIIENPQEWAEEFAEKALVKEVPTYLKAKKIGEKFAREITD